MSANWCFLVLYSSSERNKAWTISEWHCWPSCATCAAPRQQKEMRQEEKKSFYYLHSLHMLGHSVSSSIIYKQGSGLVEVVAHSSGACSTKRRRKLSCGYLTISKECSMKVHKMLKGYLEWRNHPALSGEGGQAV